MALGDLASKADQIWSLMPEFGEESSSAQDPNSFINQVNKYTQPTSAGNDMAIDPNWIQAGSQVLGALAGGATPSSASASSPQYANFNNSGMTVATSGSKADGSPILPWYVWVIAGVAVIKIFRKKKA